jgi:hypothetical protein
LPIYRGLNHRLGAAVCLERMAGFEKKGGYADYARLLLEEALENYQMADNLEGEARCAAALAEFGTKPLA